MRKSEKPVEDAIVIINGWARTAGNAPENSERITFCGVVFFLKNSCQVKSPPPRVLINVKHHTQRGICLKGGGLFKVHHFGVSPFR